MDKVAKVISLLEDGNQKEALNAYNDILTTGTAEEKFLLGEELFQLGFLEEAKTAVEMLLQAYPEEGELLVLYAEINLESGDEESAMLALDQISKDDPVFPQALLLLADLYQMNGLYEVSEQKLLQAKDILPDQAVIDFALGELYAEQGKFTEARQSYGSVLNSEMEISGVNVHQRMAEVLSASGFFEEAVPHYEIALDAKLEINTLFGFAFTALQAGYNRSAIEKFLELKELDPEYHSLYLYLAKAYEREEELENSLNAIKSGIKQDEFNKDLFLFGGKIALKLGEEEQAEEFFRGALVLDPELTEAALLLNKLFIKQERYDDVLDIVNEMNAQGEEEPQLFWDQAIAYQRLEEYSQALNSYQHAYTFFKNHPDFLQDYGYFLIEEGKRTEAAEIFSMLLSADPTNEEYKDILDRLLE